MKDPFNVVVIGEYCLDVFEYGFAKRRNPEAPSLVFNPHFQSVTPGMAGNVAACVKRLDSKANVVLYSNFSKVSKRRFVDKASGYILFRLDEGDILPDEDFAKMEWGLDGKLKEAGISYNEISCVLVADYCKGFLSCEFLSELIKKSNEFHFPVFMDTKKVLGNWSSGCFVTKINDPEYTNLLKHIPNPQDYTDNLIVTNGERGAFLVNRGTVFPVDKVDVVNLCGAGDVFNAALALSFVRGYSLEESITYANKAASIKVTRQGTAVVDGLEVWG